MKRRQLSDEVAVYVRELVISGIVRPGEFLRMEPIAEALGVSNTPVREGLLTLSSEGIVRLVPRRGFVVAPFTQQDLRDLFWAKARLGAELAARAVDKIAKDEIETLEAIRQLADPPITASYVERTAELENAFDRELHRAAESRALAMLHSSMAEHLPNGLYVDIPGDADATREKHRLLVAALRERDPDKARSVIERHALERAAHLIALLEARGVWGANDRAQATGHPSSPTRITS